MVGILWNKLRGLMYDAGIFRVARSSMFVISIGNLTWGGTGKTSMVLHIANFLMERGYRVAILSRGYGRKSKTPHLISDGKQLFLSWQKAGDEPFVLAQALPKAAVAVARERSEGLKLLEPLNPDVVLLDD